MRVEDWQTVNPFHCDRCALDVAEGWALPGLPPIHADCGAYLRPSAWLVRWYTTRNPAWKRAALEMLSDMREP